MDNTKLLKLQHFFQVDLEIKRKMYNLAPSNLKYLDEESIKKYTDELDDLLTYSFCELKCVSLDIFGDDTYIYTIIERMENNIKNQFYSCGFDINKLKNFYEKYISNMTPEFINRVKQECVAYKIEFNIPLEIASSINEILHFIHSSVLNNENVLQSMPLLNNKTSVLGEPISLRGKNVDLFNQLFELFPTNLEVGITDMVAINDKKLIMMVRGRGHALSIEITLSGNTARMEYFIPKICNVDMVNSLPGVNKVNDDSIGTTGVIETELINLPNVLFDYISKVPTDYDIEREPFMAF